MINCIPNLLGHSELFVVSAHELIIFFRVTTLQFVEGLHSLFYHTLWDIIIVVFYPLAMCEMLHYDQAGS